MTKTARLGTQTQSGALRKVSVHRIGEAVNPGCIGRKFSANRIGTPKS